jgi:hypothetical protein
MDGKARPLDGVGVELQVAESSWKGRTLENHSVMKASEIKPRSQEQHLIGSRLDSVTFLF